MVATRNDGHQKNRKRRCFPIFGVPLDQLNDWRAIASRKNGERAAAGRKNSGGGACVYVLPPPFPPAQAISAGALLRHRRVANQP
jgi:hypothetical protein